MFFTDDLAYVRQEWLNEGHVPRANCRGYNKFNSITRSTPEGDCTVKQRPQFYADIKAVMESIDVPYNGTGIGKATLQAIEFLMKPKREETPNKEAYLAKQKYSCASCGTLLLDVSSEIHHQPRICESHENQIMILCQPCHQEMSSEAAQVGNTFSIQSRFSPHAVKYFRNQSAPVPLVLKHSNTEAGRTWQLDIVRCRANCWKYSASPFSVFTCLDSIRERTEEKLADWNWIELPACTTSSDILKMAPFTSCLLYTSDAADE